MTIQDVVAGLSQMPQQPTPVNPALIPAAAALRQVPTAVTPPRGNPMGAPMGAGAIPRHDSSLQGLMQGAPGGSRPNGGLPALISSLGLNDANSGTQTQPSSDNTDEEGSGQ
jgi:hypothetical protein